MGYLLLPGIHHAWMILGNAKAVLAWALSRNLHLSLPFISPSQFVQDLQWLHGAMLQSIQTRGRTIVKKHSSTQDGIAAWHQFLKVHRHGGNANVYLNEQQQIVTTCYYDEYPGGLLSYLETVEDAFDNIEHMHQESNNHAGIPLYSDAVKRLMFIQNATTTMTANLIESTEQSAETWDTFVSGIFLALF